MTTVREHLSAYHMHAGEHHTGMAKVCKALATHHAALSSHLEITDPKAAAMHKGLGEEHSAMANHHLAAAEFHMAACKQCNDDAEKIAKAAQPLPTGLSAIIGEAAPRAIPRVGQREISEVRKQEPALATAILGPDEE